MEHQPDSNLLDESDHATDAGCTSSILSADKGMDHQEHQQLDARSTVKTQTGVRSATTMSIQNQGRLESCSLEAGIRAALHVWRAALNSKSELPSVSLLRELGLQTLGSPPYDFSSVVDFLNRNLEQPKESVHETDPKVREKIAEDVKKFYSMPGLATRPLKSHPKDVPKEEFILDLEKCHAARSAIAVEVRMPPLRYAALQRWCSCPTEQFEDQDLIDQFNLLGRNRRQEWKEDEALDPSEWKGHVFCLDMWHLPKTDSDLYRLFNSWGKTSGNDGCIYVDELAVLEPVTPEFHPLVFHEVFVPPTKLCLHDNKLEGEVDLTKSPASLQELSLNGNGVLGPVDYNSIPETLKMLYSHEKKLEGKVDLKELPESLKSLLPHENTFTGSVDLTDPPKALVKLEGEVDLKELPESVAWMQVCKEELEEARRVATYALSGLH